MSIELLALAREIRLSLRDIRKFAFTIPKGKVMFVWLATMISWIAAITIVVWALASR